MNSAAPVTVHLDTSGGFRRGHVIKPEALLGLPDKIRTGVSKSMGGFGQEILAAIKMGYVSAIRVRPRVEGEHLMDRLQKAMTMDVRTPLQEVYLAIFDLNVMDRLTRNEGRGTTEHGWFANLEDGHGEPEHGSKDFAFVSLEWADELAQDAAEQMGLNQEKRAEFLTQVSEDFAGRHGEGIMVNLDKPLFFRYPQYGADPGNEGSEGTARNIIGDHGHPGYKALDVLETVGNMSRQKMKDMAVQAVNKVGKTL